jgi:hypothetical protein
MVHGLTMKHRSIVNDPAFAPYRGVYSNGNRSGMNGGQIVPAR